MRKLSKQLEKYHKVAATWLVWRLRKVRLDFRVKSKLKRSDRAASTLDGPDLDALPSLYLPTVWHKEDVWMILQAHKTEVDT